jgi:hypothetical protein
MKLNLIRRTNRSFLTFPLQMSDRIKKRRISPGFNRTLRVQGGDDQ